MNKDEAIAELARRHGVSVEQERARLASKKIPQQKNINQANNPIDVLKSIGLEKEAANLESQAPIKRKGLAGVATDIAKGAYNAIPAGVEFAFNLPGDIYEAGKLAFTNPELAKRNVKAGSASAIGGLLSTPGNVVDYLREKELAPSWLEAMRPENVGLLGKDFDYRAAEGLGEPMRGEQFIYGGSQFVPNLAFGKLSPAAWASGQGENPVTAQLMPKVAHEVVKPAISTIKKTASAAKNMDLTPSGQIAKYVKNNISLSELADNVRAAEGTNTPLGDIVKSPYLKKKFENELPYKVPYETEQALKQINEQIQQKADKLMFDEIGKGLPDQDTNPMVKDVLRKAYEDNRKIKNNLYKEATQLALDENLQLDFNDFNKLVKDNMSAIEESPLLKNNSDFRKLFNKLAGLTTEENINIPEKTSAIVNEFGRPAVIEAASEKTLRPTITEANVIANDLYDTGQQMLRSPNAIDRQQGNLYVKLSNALRGDVDKSIQTKGSSALKEAAREAKAYYKDDFVQFLDKDLYRLLDETKDPNVIVRNIIKPSKKVDNSALIEKVQNVLPANQKGLLGYTYLRGAIDKNGILQPALLKQQINSLGVRQFEALFPDAKMRQAILDFTKLHNMNSEAASYLLNPKTGQRNLGFIKELVSYIPEGLVAGGSAASGGIVGGLLGLVATKMAKTASNKYMLQLLTSEEFRNKVGEKIKQRKAQTSKDVNIPEPKFAAAVNRKEENE